MKYFLATVLLLIAVKAEATTYWASPAGAAGSCAAASGTSDPGTYRTLTQGTACLTSPGDILILKNGNYTTSQGSISIPTGGSSWNTSGYYTIRAQNQGGAVMLGTWPWCTFNCSTAGYVMWSDIKIDGTGAPITGTFTNRSGGTESYANGPILAGNASGNHHLRFDNMEITKFSGIAVQLGGNGSWISNSTVHDNGTTSNDNCVYASDGASNVIIEHNTIYNCTGAGVQLYDSGSTSPNSVVRFNTIHDTSTSSRQLDGTYHETANAETRVDGILIASGHDGAQVYGNVIYNITLASGVDQGAIAAILHVTNVEIYNNTIYNTAGQLGIFTDCAVGTIIKNNIIYQMRNGAGFTVSGSCATLANNVADGTNPLFVNAAAGNFQLQTGSPAINAGAALGSAFATDIVGTPRPQPTSGAWDIGAYEYIGGTLPVLLVTGSNPSCAEGSWPQATCTVNSATIALSGLSTQSGGSVGYTTNRGDSGSAIGQGTWTINQVNLKAGINDVTITGTDGSGNSGAVVQRIIYTPTFPGNALVGAWGFESNANDSSGAGNNGTLAGGPSYVTGKYGNGIQLNGSTQYVNVSDANSLDLTQSFTISAWVNPSVVDANYRSILIKNSNAPSGGPPEPYALYGIIGDECGAGGIAGFLEVNGVVGPYSNVCTASPLQLNIFTHIAVTYDNATQQLNLYRQGLLVNTTTASGYMEPSAQSLNIGASEYGEYFQGVIDEVRLYNFAIPRTSANNSSPGAACNAEEYQVATASIVGDMNCPVIPAAPPPTGVAIEFGASTTVEFGASTTVEFGQ